MSNTVFCLCIVILTLASVNTNRSLKFYEEKNFHDPIELTDQQILDIAGMSDERHFTHVLDQIMIPRVVGTPNHVKVGNFIVDQMRGLGWAVEEDTFIDRTPVFPNLQFRNIIAKLNPDADRFLVLACHYDSKYTREHVFVGATDSAVPCAMMINLAKVMQSKLEKLKQSSLSLMLLFLDGEEAFKQWSPTDSIYGARHLADKWQKTQFRDGAHHLKRIDMFVLLDLLGAPDPVFYSYFHATNKWYSRLAVAEGKLARLNQLRGYSRGKEEQRYFRLRSFRAGIEDDHLPFLQRNVDILHLIPSPFPDVWHTAGDDASALDFNTIDNLNKILRVFTTEYLRLT